MLLCKGKGCIWKRVCSRWVIGHGVSHSGTREDRWMNKCLHASKFHRIHGAKDEICPPEGKETAL